MSYLHRARAFMRCVSALEPTSTTPRCPADARKIAQARLITYWDDQDPFWTPEMVLIAAFELDLLASFEARGAPAIIDLGQFARVVGSKTVGRMILGAAGFYVDGHTYTNHDPEIDHGQTAVKITIPATYLSDALRNLTVEARELESSLI